MRPLISQTFLANMEINFKAAALKKLVVHYVGSKNNLDPLLLSNESLLLEAEMLQLIGESFLNKFNTTFDYYQFHHSSALQFNEVYSYAKDFFSDNNVFEEASLKIARHLYESSTHPKVKGGELYVAFFEG